MRRLVYVLPFLAAFSAACAKPEPPVDPDMLVGEWLNIRYAQTLKETRSPKRASLSVRDVIWIQVSKVPQEDGPDTYRLKLGYDRFRGREQFDYLTLGRNMGSGDYYPISEDKRLLTGYHRFGLTTRSPDTLAFFRVTAGEGFDRQGFRSQFTRLPGTLQDFLNETLLIGTYRDGKGRTYRFEKGCTAVWPGLTFSYTILPDTIGDDYLAFGEVDRVRGRRRRYEIPTVFRWRDGRLEFCREEEKPVLFLEPVQ